MNKWRISRCGSQQYHAFCTEGYNGEHATSVNGTGHPILDDMIIVGVKNKMAESKCREIYDKVVFSASFPIYLPHLMLK